MQLRSRVLTLLLVAVMLHSLVGQGLVMLCTDMTGEHSAFERSTNDACPVKATDQDCGDDDLHFDDPANHQGDIDPCTDQLVELSDSHTGRNEVQDHSVQVDAPLPNSPALELASVPHGSVYLDSGPPQFLFETSSSISSTVLLI